ncbi:MAG: recombinase family protein [Gammaproteobacteria bacterium]|nr:recombinase family protein [Gammaproteobacteria bacterium]
MKTAAIYARVSTTGQTVANQVRVLRQAAKRNGWQVVEVFKDEGISGAKGREARLAFDGLYKAIMRKEVDLIMAWSVDRLGRSLQDLVAFLNEVHSKGVDLYLHQQGIDTTTPGGKVLFQMMGVFAEFERAMIQERIQAGLDRARAQGKRLGRPPISDKTKHAIRRHRQRGMSIKRIAAKLGVGVGTVQRTLAEAR